jgi:hypothetical protein
VSAMKKTGPNAPVPEPPTNAIGRLKISPAARSMRKKETGDQLPGGLVLAERNRPVELHLARRRVVSSPVIRNSREMMMMTAHAGMPTW